MQNKTSGGGGGGAKCSALTQAGTQCSRNATKGHYGFCKQHFTMKHKIHSTSDVEPWHVIGFSKDPDPRNGTAVLHKIRTLLRKGPKHNDAPGFIYIFQYKLDMEQNLSYYKIGRTTQHVEKRLRQWKGSCFQWCCSTQYNVFAESLIFLWLDYFRMHRIPRTDGQGYHSVRHADATLVKDKQSVIDESERKKLLIAKRKETEWFNVDYEYAKRVVKSILHKLVYIEKK